MGARDGGAGAGKLVERAGMSRPGPGRALAGSQPASALPDCPQHAAGTERDPLARLALPVDVLHELAGVAVAVAPAAIPVALGQQPVRGGWHLPHWPEFVKRYAFANATPRYVR